MVLRLSTAQPDFISAFDAFLKQKREEVSDVGEVVRGIIAQVRAQGDAALVEYTERFDKVKYDATSLRISEDGIAKAEADCAPGVKDALKQAAERVKSYHERQVEQLQNIEYADGAGITLGWRWQPLARAGIYVPGGKASYPSSVLMNAIPAKVAGVPQIAMVVPTPYGEINPALLVAARLAGVDEIYKIGGAQAVAALAYGTESISPVDKIVGPGNAYVAEAKRQVFGQVGIDMIAGPSEICVVADGKSNPEWIAADLLSQAEHDVQAQSILITDDVKFADAVDAAVTETLKTLSRREIAAQSWEKFGGMIVVRGWAEAKDVVNRIAPEHLELAIEEPEKFSRGIVNAGAIFLGRHAPEALGDYIAGPSHVLPTSGTARFSSVLSVSDFVKRISIIGSSEAGIKALSPAIEALAEAEGLQAHGLSAKLRR